MFRRITVAIAATCSLLGLATPLAAHAQQANARVIVQFKADSGLLRKQVQAAGERHASQALALGQRVGLALTSGSGVGERSQVVFARGMSSEALAERLAREADVEYAVPDQRKRFVAVPNDPRYTTVAGNGPASGQWYLRPPSNTPGGVMAAINAEAAWDITTGSNSIVVAVLDTGITSHPDLNGNVLPGYDMVGPDNQAGTVFDTANDGNGRDADASDPGDWISQADIDAGKFPGACDSSADISDSSWHGTQTAGLIGALTNNGTGMASVGRTVRIVPVRVLGKCGGFDSDILAGMRWAAGIDIGNGIPVNANPAKVINMSLGGGSTCTQPYRDAVSEITALGVTIVASAGNSAGRAVSEPASCNGVIGVAGLRHIGTKVGFSDLGSQISISAPGGNCVNTGNSDPCLYPILTTTNAGATVPGAASYSDAFNASVGTSFSAPLAAGTAALMASVDPAIAPAEVRSLLRATARPFPNAGADAGTPICTAPTSADQNECYCTTSTCGAGILDARAAVAAAMGFIADIAATPTSPRVDVAMALSGAGSTAPAGRSIVYTWSIADAGTTGAALSATTGPSVSVTSSATGRFTVTLTITDGSVTTSTTRAFDVAAAPSSGGGGGGGGGAADPAWVLALLAAVGLLRRTNRSGRQG